MFCEEELFLSCLESHPEGSRGSRDVLPPVSADRPQGSVFSFLLFLLPGSIAPGEHNFLTWEAQRQRAQVCKVTEGSRGRGDSHES